MDGFELWFIELLKRVRHHLCEGFLLGARGEHGKRSWQAERGKHQIFGFLQILEQQAAKFVNALCHQKRRWQVFAIIVGHHIFHLRFWYLGTIFSSMYWAGMKYLWEQCFISDFLNVHKQISTMLLQIDQCQENDEDSVQCSSHWKELELWCFNLMQKGIKLLKSRRYIAL